MVADEVGFRGDNIMGRLPGEDFEFRGDVHAPDFFPEWVFRRAALH